MYKQTILDNGLRVITHPIAERNSIAIGFWIGVGGRYEADPIKGAAHFLEHIVFKGSEKYSCEEIKELIEGVGGTLNAFTSEEQTCFYAKIPTAHLNTTFDVLADMVAFPKIIAKDVTKEKTVIIEEIKMYHDLPQYAVMELLDGLMWPDHPLGKSLAGTMDSVSGLNAKELRQFHQDYYVPTNMVVAACGNLDHEKLVAMVKKKMGGLKNVKHETYRRADHVHTKPGIKIFKKKIEQTRLALGMPAYDENNNDRYALSLINTVLGANMSSRLFVELREKRGLAYSVSTSVKPLHDTGLFMVRAGVDNNKLPEALELTIKELDKLRRKGITDDEFKRAKDYVSGQLMLALEDTMDHMLWIGEDLIAKNSTRTLESVIQEFERITQEDINRVAKEVLNKNKYKLAVVGPLTDAQEKQVTQLVAL